MNSPIQSRLSNLFPKLANLKDNILTHICIIYQFVYLSFTNFFNFKIKYKAFSEDFDR